MVTYISGKVACCNHLISVEMLQSTEKIWFAKDKLGCNSFTPVLQFYTSGKGAINGKDWVHQFDRNLLQKCVNCVNRAWNKKLTDIWRPPFGWKWNEAASDLELFLPKCTVLSHTYSLAAFCHHSQYNFHSDFHQNDNWATIWKTSVMPQIRFLWVLALWPWLCTARCSHCDIIDWTMCKPHVARLLENAVTKILIGPALLCTCRAAGKNAKTHFPPSFTQVVETNKHSDWAWWWMEFREAVGCCSGGIPPVISAQKLGQ